LGDKLREDLSVKILDAINRIEKTNTIIEYQDAKVDILEANLIALSKYVDLQNFEQNNSLDLVDKSLSPPKDLLNGNLVASNPEHPLESAQIIVDNPRISSSFTRLNSAPKNLSPGSPNNDNKKNLSFADLNILTQYSLPNNIPEVENPLFNDKKDESINTKSRLEKLESLVMDLKPIKQIDNNIKNIAIELQKKISKLQLENENIRNSFNNELGKNKETQNLVNINHIYTKKELSTIIERIMELEEHKVVSVNRLAPIKGLKIGQKKAQEKDIEEEDEEEENKKKSKKSDDEFVPKTEAETIAFELRKHNVIDQNPTSTYVKRIAKTDNSKKIMSLPTTPIKDSSSMGGDSVKVEEEEEQEEERQEEEEQEEAGEECGFDVNSSQAIKLMDTINGLKQNIDNEKKNLEKRILDKENSMVKVKNWISSFETLYKQPPNSKDKERAGGIFQDRINIVRNYDKTISTIKNLESKLQIAILKYDSKYNRKAEDMKTLEEKLLKKKMNDEKMIELENLQKLSEENKKQEKLFQEEMERIETAEIFAREGRDAFERKENEERVVRELKEKKDRDVILKKQREETEAIERKRIAELEAIEKEKLRTEANKKLLELEKLQKLSEGNREKEKLILEEIERKKAAEIKERQERDAFETAKGLEEQKELESLLLKEQQAHDERIAKEKIESQQRLEIERENLRLASIEVEKEKSRVDIENLRLQNIAIQSEKQKEINRLEAIAADEEKSRLAALEIAAEKERIALLAIAEENSRLAKIASDEQKLRLANIAIEEEKARLTAIVIEEEKASYVAFEEAKRVEKKLLENDLLEKKRIEEAASVSRVEEEIRLERDRIEAQRIEDKRIQDKSLKDEAAQSAVDKSNLDVVEAEKYKITPLKEEGVVKRGDDTISDVKDLNVGPKPRSSGPSVSTPESGRPESQGRSRGNMIGSRPSSQDSRPGSAIIDPNEAIAKHKARRETMDLNMGLISKMKMLGKNAKKQVAIDEENEEAINSMTDVDLVNEMLSKVDKEVEALNSESEMIKSEIKEWITNFTRMYNRKPSPEDMKDADILKKSYKEVLFC
jgi:hypothetical protein